MARRILPAARPLPRYLCRNDRCRRQQTGVFAAMALGEPHARKPRQTPDPHRPLPGTGRAASLGRIMTEPRPGRTTAAVPPSWGVCTTLRAPVDQMLAFVAHHLALGAQHIWLHFDDPADPAADLAATLPGVTAIRCDPGWWRRTVGHRPARHQNRQARNIQTLCDAAPLPWLLHADVDEFLIADRPVARLLAELPPDRLMLRVAPWEALHDPGLTDDIFTACHFRAALTGAARAPDRARAFGRYAPLLPDGVLSHAAGKCLFRTGIPGFEPRLHGAFLHKTRLDGGAFHPDLALLHFHAPDPLAWRDRLAFRLTKGAYQYNPALQGFLQTASPGEIGDFYAAVQQVSPDTLATLADLGVLRQERLHLRARVAALRRPAPPPSSDRR